MGKRHWDGRRHGSSETVECQHMILIKTTLWTPNGQAYVNENVRYVRATCPHSFPALARSLACSRPFDVWQRVGVWIISIWSLNEWHDQRTGNPFWDVMGQTGRYSGPHHFIVGFLDASRWTFHMEFFKFSSHFVLIEFHERPPCHQSTAHRNSNSFWSIAFALWHNRPIGLCSVVRVDHFSLSARRNVA